MIPRRDMRERVIQYLFGCDALSNWNLEGIERFHEAFYSDRSLDEVDQVTFSSLVEGVINNLTRIDQTLEAASENWKLDKMSRIDRNIMRLAVYELQFDKDLSSAIVINEALEIAKRFSAEESPSFINGVLDRVTKNMPAAPN